MYSFQFVCHGKNVGLMMTSQPNHQKIVQIVQIVQIVTPENEKLVIFCSSFHDIIKYMICDT